MKIFAVLASALTLALAPETALAQSPNVGRPISLQQIAPGVAIYCDDGTGRTALCSFAGGGGGGGTGDASAANQASQIAAEQAIRDRIGALTSPASGSTNFILTSIQSLLGGTLTVGTHAVTQSGTWNVGSITGSVSLPTGAATAANQVTANTSLATIATNTGLGRDAGGRLLPGQGAVATTRTTLAASTATALEGAGVSGRIAQSVFTEAALTANVYICTSQTTSCSATSYDFLLPSGAAAGSVYTAIFGTTGRIYAWSTGTPVLVLNSWIAQ